MTGDDTKRGVRVALHLLAYVVACGLFVAVRGRSIFLPILAVFAVIGTALRLHECVRSVLQKPGNDLYKRVRWAAPLLVVGVALGWIGRSAGADGWLFFGVALAFLGLGLVIEQLRSNEDVPQVATPWLLGAMAAFAFIGAGVMAFTGFGKGVVLLAVAFGLFPLAVGLAAERVLRPTASGKWATGWTALGGAALTIVALGVMVLLGANGTYVAMVAIALFLLVLAVVARSNADVVVVIAMAAVVWTLTARPAPEPENLKPKDGASVIAALGDSYISGEGADQFYENTNVKGTECRRAPTAYPPLLLSEDLPNDYPSTLLFLACSGATIDQVSAQADVLEQRVSDDDLDVQLVLLSVGGNDSLFGAIGRICILPTDCTELGDAWRANLTTLEARLTTLYQRISTASGGAPVVVVPYPIPIAEQSCGYSALSGKEHDFLNAFTEELDQVVARAAAAGHVFVVDTAPDAFVGQRICDRDEDGHVVPAGDAAVNFLAAHSVFGTLEQSVSPTNWFHNSLHPNVRGHDLLRATVLLWLTDHADELDEPAPTVSALQDRPAPTFPEAGSSCRGETGDDLQGCSWKWATRSVGAFLLLGLLVAAALIFGLFLVAVFLVRQWRNLDTPTVAPPGS